MESSEVEFPCDWPNCELTFVTAGEAVDHYGKCEHRSKSTSDNDGEDMEMESEVSTTSTSDERDKYQSKYPKKRLRDEPYKRTTRSVCSSVGSRDPTSVLENIHEDRISEVGEHGQSDPSNVYDTRTEYREQNPGSETGESSGSSYVHESSTKIVSEGSEKSRKQARENPNRSSTEDTYEIQNLELGRMRDSEISHEGSTEDDLNSELERSREHDVESSDDSSSDEETSESERDRKSNLENLEGSFESKSSELEMCESPHETGTGDIDEGTNFERRSGKWGPPKSFHQAQNPKPESGDKKVPEINIAKPLHPYASTSYKSSSVPLKSKSHQVQNPELQSDDKRVPATTIAEPSKPCASTCTCSICSSSNVTITLDKGFVSFKIQDSEFLDPPPKTRFTIDEFSRIKLPIMVCDNVKHLLSTREGTSTSSSTSENIPMAPPEDTRSEPPPDPVLSAPSVEDMGEPSSHIPDAEEQGMDLQRSPGVQFLDTSSSSHEDDLNPLKQEEVRKGLPSQFLSYHDESDPDDE